MVQTLVHAKLSSLLALCGARNSGDLCLKELAPASSCSAVPTYGTTVHDTRKVSVDQKEHVAKEE